MGRLAELAKTDKLKGKVQVNFKDGTSRVFADEKEADENTKGLALEHRRGAFHEVAATPITAAPSAPKTAKKAAPKPVAENSEEGA